MISILICTHGGLARELVNTAELMMGRQEGLHAICLEMHEGIEDLREKLENLLQPPGQATNGYLLMVDIFGGTPSNVALTLAREYPPLQILTGVNLPMLIEALLHRHTVALKPLAGLVKEKGQKSILLANELLSLDPGKRD